MLKKIFIGLIVFIVFFIGILALAPLIFKDKLMQIARQEINRQLTAKVDWSDMGVSAFKDFPNISLYMKNLVVVNDTPFKGDTLAQIGEVVIGINPVKLLNGRHIDVSAIVITKPYIHVRVLKDGSANYNIMRPDSVKAPVDTSKGPGYSVSLKKFSIKNAYIIYDDKEDGLYAELDDFTNKFSGNLAKNEFVLTDKGTAASVIVKDGKVTYLNKVKVALNVTMDIDQAKGKYTLKKNSIQLNDLSLGVDGNVVMVNSKNITSDLMLKVNEPDFRHLISLIPAVYSEDFKKVKTTGGLTLAGYVKGKYNGVSYPAFGVSLKVDNGTFQYPDLPAGVSGINIDINAKNPGGSLDNTVVDVDKFEANLAGDPLKMHLHITNPVLDPEIEAAVTAKIDLGGVKTYYPLKGDELTGNVNIDVSAKGKLSAIEKQQYQDFDAQGTIDVSNVKYVSKDLPEAVQINTLKLSFKPELVSLDALSAQIGKSDFTATGEVDNLLNYLFTKATLKGKLKLQANVLDLNEFLAADPNAKTTIAPETKAKPEPKPATAVKAAPKPSSTSAQVPANIDFTVDAYAGKVYYTNIVIDSMQGEIIVRNETITLNGLTGKVFDGGITLNGDYTTLRTENPQVDMKMNLDMIDVEKAAIGFEKLLASLPIARSVRGVLSTVLNVKTELDKEMSPKLKTMVADGRIDIHHLDFKANKTTDNLAERTKIGELKMLKSKDFFTTVKVANGNLYVEPFNMHVGKINLMVYGSQSLGDSSSSDYSMMMDAPAGSDTTAKGKRTKFKIGMHGKAGEATVHQATDENDTAIQNATDEQQNLKDAASQAKQQSETKFQQEQDKRKQAAAEKAQKKADGLKAQADQKAKDQAGASAQ
jgi:hypothetical protein